MGFATLFNRPTPLDGPRVARHWWIQFRAAYLDCLELPAREAVLDEAKAQVRPILFQEGARLADYSRLRFVAQRQG